MWIFGKDKSPSETDLGYRINFNEKPALPVVQNVGTMMDAANASICDKDGNLLFYTNGSQVMTRHATLMENGDSINYDEWVEHFWFEKLVRSLDVYQCSLEQDSIWLDNPALTFQAL
jgi:hypothetical protein